MKNLFDSFIKTKIINILILNIDTMRLQYKLQNTYINDIIYERKLFM